MFSSALARSFCKQFHIKTSRSLLIRDHYFKKILSRWLMHWLRHATVVDFFFLLIAILMLMSGVQIQMLASSYLTYDIESSGHATTKHISVLEFRFDTWNRQSDNDAHWVLGQSVSLGDWRVPIRKGCFGHNKTKRSSRTVCCPTLCRTEWFMFTPAEC